MSFVFNSDEIFEIAEQIERNGARFYSVAAGKFSDPSLKNKLLDLSKMEEQHVKTFAALRAELLDGKPEETTFDPDNEAALYLQAVAEGKVFNLKDDSSALLSGDFTIEEILKTAIGLEKESIVFYTTMKDLIPEKLGKSKIDIIINEEVGHIVDLRKQLESL